MLDRFSLAGRVALVTGGNRGLGRGIALALAEAGADIAIAARNPETAAATCAEIEALGRRATFAACDMRDRSDIDAAVEHAVGALGRLDILVNNAGMGIRGPAAEIRDEDWDEVLETNLRAVLQCSRAAYPHLRTSGHGRIINLASMWSYFGTPTVASYAASKGGVVQLTKSLAVSWAPDGIRVNAIAPGFIHSDLTAPLAQDPQRHAQIVGRTPLGRFGEPEDLAGAVIFLASDASEFVTGQTLPIDGGYSIA
jgi:NAD(P)-dependent dehydrogenase (short-subunit alcohol dehydrogenase family)